MLIKINDVEFDFDIYDIDQSEAFERAIDQLSTAEAEIKAAQETQKVSVVNRAVIAMFRKFFVEATGVDVLASCKNSSLASEAYTEFLGEIGKMEGQLFQKYGATRVR